MTKKIKLNGQEAQTKFEEVFTNNTYIVVKTDFYTFTISMRPAYCDRGRFMVIVNNVSHLLNPVDDGDMFPRYYFNLQRCLDELYEFYTFRREKYKEKYYEKPVL